MTEIVLGPPGTGKTTTLLGIVEEELARGTEPERIGYFSFTRRAAEEAVTRAAERFGFERNRMPFFSTLHSVCFRQLGLRRGDVFDGAHLKEFARYAGVRITGRWSEDGTLTGYETGDRAIFVENLARVRELTLRQQYDRGDASDISWHDLKRISDALHVFKSEKGLMDYTDMLSEFVASQIDVGLEVLLVDEAQDLSRLQWRVVAQLARGTRRVVVAGDDDQAIYSWAGADVDHLVEMEGDVRVLNRSWRVPPEVQALANTVVSQIKHRREKVWEPREGTGTIDRWNEFGAVDVDGPDVLVLARNSYILRQVEDELRHRGVVWERNGHPSIKRSLLDAITHWERLRRGERITAYAARGVYSWMSSGVGVARGHKTLPGLDDEDEVSLAELREHHGLLRDEIWHEALDRLPAEEMSYMLAARRRGERFQSRPRVRLSTIHSAKGAEADHVVLMLEVARRTSREAELAPDDEARVWYVGLTRARHRLSLVDSSTALACPWL